MNTQTDKELLLHDLDFDEMGGPLIFSWYGSLRNSVKATTTYPLNGTPQSSQIHIIHMAINELNRVEY